MRYSWEVLGTVKNRLSKLYKFLNDNGSTACKLTEYFNYFYHVRLEQRNHLMCQKQEKHVFYSIECPLSPLSDFMGSVHSWMASLTLTTQQGGMRIVWMAVCYEPAKSLLQKILTLQKFQKIFPLSLKNPYHHSFTQGLFIGLLLRARCQSGWWSYRRGWNRQKFLSLPHLGRSPENKCNSWRNSEKKPEWGKGITVAMCCRPEPKCIPCSGIQHEPSLFSEPDKAGTTTCCKDPWEVISDDLVLWFYLTGTIRPTKPNLEKKISMLFASQIKFFFLFHLYLFILHLQPHKLECPY